MIFLAIAVPALLICASIFGMHSSLAELAERATSAWSDIDGQLKRRHALIPDLVGTMKGYVAHEKDTFENIARLRAQAMQAETPDAKAQAENQLSEVLKGLFAMAKNSPHLRASEEFTALQGRFNSMEENIQSAGRSYNALAREVNTRFHSFPMFPLVSRFVFQDLRFFETMPPPTVKTGP